jgi:putative endonuclease
MIDRFKKYQYSILSKLPDSYSDIFIKFSNDLIEFKKLLIDRGFEVKFSYETYKSYCNSSYILLFMLSKLNIKIHELNNEILEDFLHSNKSLKYNNFIRRFIKWIINNVKLFRKIPLPKCVSPSTGHIYSEEELYLIMDLLNSSSSISRDKLICMLVLFYAIRPFEISKLKHSDYKRIQNKSFLRVRETWVQMDPLITNTIDEYIKTERNSNYCFGSTEDRIFYGCYSNKPLAVPSICHILKQNNINASKAFSTAISNLFTTTGVTPSILIKGLGLNPATVTGYYKALGINNSNEGFFSSYESITRLNATKKYFVYILKCSDGSYYTGYTSNIDDRLKQHSSGTGSNYTKTRTPVRLVYTEDFSNKLSALKREKQIKKLTVFEKEQLIEKSRMNN